MNDEVLMKEVEEAEYSLCIAIARRELEAAIRYLDDNDPVHAAVSARSSLTWIPKEREGS